MKIVFSHCTQSYPINFSASNVKVEYISKGLMLREADVVIINDVFGDRKLHKNMKATKNNITYYLFQRSGKNVFKIMKNILSCVNILCREYHKNDLNILFVGGVFPVFILQILVAKILGYKCVFLTQEWSLSLNNKRLIDKIGAYCSCFLYGKIVDVILPISHFLYDKNLHFKKPMLLTPILADFKDDNTDYKNQYYNHFAYCAGAAYFRVIKMMLGAYKLFVENGGEQKLILIISGREKDINDIKEYVKQMGLEKMVIFKHQIPYEELMDIYKSSLGLLIPLDPDSVQDKARFSQKIAEYLSVKRPLITSNVGEIPFYFTPYKDILVAEYNEKAYCDAMSFLAKNIQKADAIGKEGFYTGRREFDYRTMGEKMYNFFINLDK